MAFEPDPSKPMTAPRPGQPGRKGYRGKIPSAMRWPQLGSCRSLVGTLHLARSKFTGGCDFANAQLRDRSGSDTGVQRRIADLLGRAIGDSARLRSCRRNAFLFLDLPVALRSFDSSIERGTARLICARGKHPSGPQPTWRHITDQPNMGVIG